MAVQVLRGLTHTKEKPQAWDRRRSSYRRPGGGDRDSEPLPRPGGERGPACPLLLSPTLVLVSCKEPGAGGTAAWGTVAEAACTQQVHGRCPLQLISERTQTGPLGPGQRCSG